MPHVRIASVALVGLALSTIGATTPPAPSTQPSREQVLEGKIRNQENLIATLEAELKAAQTRAADADRQLAVLERQLAAYQRPAMPDPKIVPPDWKQQKFNGMAFYLVPCDVTSAPIRSIPAAPGK